jgi:C-terminal region of MMR_HSR1 domain
MLKAAEEQRQVEGLMGREFVTCQCLLSTYGQEQMLQGPQLFLQCDCTKARVTMCPPCPDSASCACAGVKAVCNEYKIHNADITMREDCDIDDLVDVIEGSRVYIPCIYAVNKIVRKPSAACNDVPPVCLGAQAVGCAPAKNGRMPVSLHCHSCIW